MSEMSASSVWVLLGDKGGDNAQLRRLVAGLGIPYTEKPLEFQPPFRQGKPRYRPTLDHLEDHSRRQLAPPWPSLVFTVGRRPAMAAAWIRRQHPTTRLVLLGRPKRLSECAAVVCPRYYRVPPHPTLITHEFPLLAPPPPPNLYRDLDNAPRPWTAIFLGGPTTPYRFDAALLQHLRQVLMLEGTRWFVTSRRTPPAFVDQLAAQLAVHLAAGGGAIRLFRWDQDPPEANPYRRLLHQADRFLVTADSISMATEVACVGKPLLLLPLTAQRRWLTSWQQLPVVNRLGLGYYRDFSAFHQALIRGHHAAWWGDPWPQPASPLPNELPLVVAQLRQRLNLSPAV